MGARGELLGQGREAVPLEDLERLMEGTGWRSRWDRLDRFLLEHPENGDAAGERLYLASRLLGLRSLAEGSPDKAPSSSQDLERTQEVFEALRGLLRVEGWPWHSGTLFHTLGARSPWVRTSSLLEGPLREAQEGLTEALRRDPDQPALWEVARGLATLSPAWSWKEVLASVEPAPGTLWPPHEAAPAMAAAWKDPEASDLLEIAGAALAQARDPKLRELFVGATARRALLRAWVPLKLKALVTLERFSEAGEFLEWARQESGKEWPELSRALAPILGRIRGDRSLPPSLSLSELAARPPAAAPEEPGLPPPLSLGLLGAPPWKAEWARLRRHEAFDAFQPEEELGWADFGPGEQRALRAAGRFGEEPRWVLVRGREVLDSGTELPAPGALADRVRAQGPPRLEELGLCLLRHPDHLQGRRLRLEALRARMPHSRLEVRLLEDARRSLAPFQVGRGSGGANAWVPQKELWESAALRALPELEGRLRSWPESGELWEAWLDWAAVHPRQPSPAVLLDGLAVWKTASRGGPGPLPTEILTRVAERLRDREAWGPLEVWCQRAWEGGLRDHVREAARRVPAGASKDQNRVLGEAAGLVAELVGPYLEALRRQGKEAERRRLLQEFQAMPGLLERSFKVPPS